MSPAAALFADLLKMEAENHLLFEECTGGRQLLRRQVRPDFYDADRICASRNYRDELYQP
jgi:hypothetical protein